jgi:ribosome-associated toxin RatA of RatAB toxin-antitoxin module
MKYMLIWSYGINILCPKLLVLTSLLLKKNQTRIHFNVEFEFKRFFHQKIAEAFFPLIENKMIESFKVRADEILD